MSLCIRTSLLPSLREYFYLPEEGVAHISDVLVSRDTDSNNLPKAKRFYTDVITAGLLRFPDTENKKYTKNADQKMVVRKTKAPLAVRAG